jgi:hypothetical protein
MDITPITALGIIDEVYRDLNLIEVPPQILHHYTSIDAAVQIIENKDLWLHHSAYLNDTSEMELAKELINKQVEAIRHTNRYNTDWQDLCNQVQTEFNKQSHLYDAFVFCMSQGDQSRILSQDVLSAWRSYGRDGRGVCLSFGTQEFISFAQSAHLTRLNRVIYDLQVQEKMIESILVKGYRRYSTNKADGVNATIAALIFVVPVLKHISFEEEKEWRFIYLPEVQEPASTNMRFHVRGDRLVPYYTMQTIGDSVDPPIKFEPSVQEIMIGPSIFQELNLKSFRFFKGRTTLARAALHGSALPYRS